MTKNKATLYGQSHLVRRAQLAKLPRRRRRRYTRRQERTRHDRTRQETKPQDTTGHTSQNIRPFIPRSRHHGQHRTAQNELGTSTPPTRPPMPPATPAQLPTNTCSSAVLAPGRGKCTSRADGDECAPTLGPSRYASTLAPRRV